MPFTVTDQHTHEFFHNGITVFRNILPPTLLADLRNATTNAASLARAQKGPQAQRLQPINAYDLPIKPFQDYAELPALHTALAHVLTPEHTYGDWDNFGLLVEPAEYPWATTWHRDFRDHMPAEIFEREFKADYDRMMLDINFLNQVNCPLYEDNCTWYVPGSHFRAKNTAAEERAARAVGKEDLREQGPQANKDRERVCLAYCQSMPNAIQLHLNAGDFALYRPAGWHLGNYVPYRKRVTLHDLVETPQAHAEWQTMMDRWTKLRTAKLA